jgi:hypothetical protein
MEQLQKLEERLRKEGLPHTVCEEIYGADILHMVSFPNSANPIVTFIFEKGLLYMYFGPLPAILSDLKADWRYCQGGANQAHDIIIGLFNTVNS